MTTNQQTVEIDFFPVSIQGIIFFTIPKQKIQIDFFSVPNKVKIYSFIYSLNSIQRIHIFLACPNARYRFLSNINTK